MNAGAAELAADALRLVDAEPARAFALAGEAVRLARPTREHLTTAVAERACGLAALHLAHVDTSVEHLSAAVAAARRAGSSRLLGEARMSLAGAFVRRGEPRRAQRVVEQALANLTGRERARALAQRGAIAQQLGRLDDAVADYREALPLLRAAGDSVWVQRVVSNRGVLRVYRSELDAATSDLHEAEKLCRELELDLQLAFCQENLGFVDTRRGDVPGALRWFDVAELTYRRLGASVGSLLVDRCELLLSVRLAREARAAAEQAVAELARDRRRLQLAEAQLLLARAALLDGDPDRALQAATSAGRTFARQQRPSRAALARYTAVEARLARPGGGAPRLPTVVALADQLGRDGSAAAELEARLLAAQLAWAAGRDAVADQQLAKAARGRHRGPAAHRAQAWYAEALRRAHRRQRRGTTHAIRTGLRILDEYHATLGASDLRAYACGQRQDLTDLGLRGALEAGSARRALAWVERGRASTLLARSVRPPDDPALALLLAQLRATVAELESARRGGQAATAARRRQLTLEATIRDHTRRRPATDGDGARLPPEALPAALAERLDEAALVEYVEFDGFLHAIVVVDGRVRLRHLCPATQVQRHYEPVPFALRRLGRARPRARTEHAMRLLSSAVRQVDDLLLRPVASQVGDRPLVVVPTERMQSVPWGLLPSLTGRPVSVAPSAALWLQAAERTPTTGPVLLAAGPELPGARREVDEIARLYPDPVVLAGRNCSVGRVADALQHSRLAHLAAHGAFRADNPLFSSLLLADGPLTVHDLELLRRVPQIVVLAACDSAQSLVCAGNELLGPAATFLSLGTSALVGSVVPVPDLAAAPLMTALHERLRRGVPAATALADAQAEVISDGELALTAAGAFICLGAGGLATTMPRRRAETDSASQLDSAPAALALSG